MLASIHLGLPASFPDEVREVVDKNGTKFRPFLPFPKSHFEEPFHHPYIIDQARQVRERIKNIRKALVKGETVAVCKTELDHLRGVSDHIWEAEKARPTGGLAYFIS